MFTKEPRVSAGSFVIIRQMDTNKRNKKHFFLRGIIYFIIFVVLATIITLGVTNGVVIGYTKDKIVSSAEAAEIDAQCIMVLGASVNPDGSPSGILQDRLDVGIDLYHAGVAPKLLMSGDNGTDTYNEVEGMKQYAISKGVPSEDIFCDHAGFSTYESMYRAEDIFEVKRLVVVTQTYHLYRAIYDAETRGIEVVGVSSDLHEYQNQSWFDTREVMARAKDFFVTVIGLEPTFRGEIISLNQSADEVE